MRRLQARVPLHQNGVAGFADDVLYAGVLLGWAGRHAVGGL